MRGTNATRLQPIAILITFKLNQLSIHKMSFSQLFKILKGRFSDDFLWQRFGAVAENDLSKREVLDLGTDREPFVADRKLRL